MSSSTEATVPSTGRGPHGTRSTRVVRAASPAAPRVETVAFRSVQELSGESDAHLLSALAEIDRGHLEALRREAYAEAYALGQREGYEHGLAEATRAVVEATDSVLGALVAAAQDLHRRDAVALDELDDVIAGFACDVAEAVVGHELAAEADPGRAALARAVGLVPDRGDLVARLNPADLATLGDVDSLVPGREITIVADASVQPGGCVLDVGSCRVDAQIASALARVRRTLGTGGPEAAA